MNTATWIGIGLLTPFWWGMGLLVLALIGDLWPRWRPGVSRLFSSLERAGGPPPKAPIVSDRLAA
jgi:hypothetical protein